MIGWLLRRLLGVTPDDGSKTGAREISIVLLAIALGLTIFVIAKGPDHISAATGILWVVWGAAITAVVGAYKLKHDLRILDRQKHQESAADAKAPVPPPDYMEGS